MSEATGRLRKAVVERVLHGAGETTDDARRAAFDNNDVAGEARALVDKVSKNAWKVTDEDIAAVKQAGMTDDQIFEIVIAAALGQSTRQLDAAHAALAQAVANRKTNDGAA